MSKKSKPRHLVGKNKPSKKTIQSPSASFSPAEPRPAATARPEPSAAPSFRTAAQAIARPARAVAPMLPASYDYVVADLKRIGVIAAALFAIMAVLTVIIR